MEAASDRSFGLVFAVVFLVVASLPLVRGGSIRLWALPVSAAFLGVALLSPRWLAPLNRVWTRFGLLLHSIVSPVALAVVFFGVVLPTGVLLRAFGKDPLRLKRDPAAGTYWIERDPPGPTAESLRNQF